METTDELSQSWTLYYEILVNGVSLGIFGHDAVRNMHLSIGFYLGTQDVFASAVCEEEGELYFYDWLQHPIEAQDQVEFRRADSRNSKPPRNKYRMNPSDAQKQHPK